MTQKEIIRQEIERRGIDAQEAYDLLGSYRYKQTAKVCKELPDFIDSLPEEEPSEDLEEEIDRWVIALQNEPGRKWRHSDILRTARHFAEWGAKHLK